MRPHAGTKLNKISDQFLFCYIFPNSSQSLPTFFPKFVFIGWRLGRVFDEPAVSVDPQSLKTGQSEVQPAMLHNQAGVDCCMLVVGILRGFDWWKFRIRNGKRCRRWWMIPAIFIGKADNFTQIGAKQMRYQDSFPHSLSSCNGQKRICIHDVRIFLVYFVLPYVSSYTYGFGYCHAVLTTNESPLPLSIWSVRKWCHSQTSCVSNETIEESWDFPNLRKSMMHTSSQKK